MTEAIALFAKAALPGGVKTRLTTRLTADQAAELHLAFVQDTWRKIEAVTPGQAYLFTDQLWEGWGELASSSRIRLQPGGDLGVRMQRCFEDLAGEGVERALIVGSDSPTLPIDCLRRGLESLKEHSDAVLGPCEDGGYYAVGCRRPLAGMFDGVRWSSDQTLADSESALFRVGYQITRLPTWWDVDTPVELDRLAADPAVGPAVAEWFLRNKSSLAGV